MRKPSDETMNTEMKTADFFKLILRGCMLAAMLAGIAALTGCGFVPQRNREFLSDQIMQRSDDELESALEGHDFPRREGSVGGGSGSGGGCGC